LRVAALVTPPGPEELLVALPNTTADEAPVARGRGRFMRGGPGGNLRYRDLQRRQHGRGPAATRAGRHPIALGGLLTTRALRSARSVRSNSPEGSSRIGVDSMISSSYATRTRPSSAFTSIPLAGTACPFTRTYFRRALAASKGSPRPRLRGTDRVRINSPRTLLLRVAGVLFHAYDSRT
jgi:hypothetical protein